MKNLALIAALTLWAPLASAQDTPETGDVAEGFSLMEEGMQLLFRGLVDEMAPALDDLKGFAGEIEPTFRAFALEMGPAMAKLLSEIDDLRHYSPPEFLPNGDIIIRRLPDAPEFLPPTEPAAPPIDL